MPDLQPRPILPGLTLPEPVREIPVQEVGDSFLVIEKRWEKESYNVRAETIHMAELLSDRVIRSIDPAAESYHRLVLLVAPPGAGKTAGLQEVHERTDAPLLNVNLELSRRMLELTERQRTLQLPRLLSQMVNAASADVVLLDNLELLFDLSLKQDPLRLLQGLSRNKTVVAAWSGSIDREHLVYATPDHPEYKRYPLRDFLVVHAEAGA